MRKGVKRVATVTVALVAVAILALPAMATVDEITGMACSGGNAVFAPPGITGGSNADNFAQPLIATGVVEFGPTGPVFTDHPASKVKSGPFPPIWDPTHPSANCKNWEPPVFGP